MPDTKRSNNPPIIIEIDAEMADFIISNCEANMRLALVAMSSPGMTIPSLEKLVSLNEKFKKLRELVKIGRKDENG